MPSDLAVFRLISLVYFKNFEIEKYGTHNKTTSHTREHLVNFVGYLEITRDCVHMTVTMHIRARTRIVARHDQHMDNNNYYNIVSTRLCAYLQDYALIYKIKHVWAQLCGLLRR